MKQLLPLLFAIFTLPALAQQPQQIGGINTRVEVPGEMIFYKTIRLPQMDTIGTAPAGSLRYRMADKTTYISDGSYWKPVGSAGTTTAVTKVYKSVSELQGISNPDTNTIYQTLINSQVANFYYDINDITTTHDGVVNIVTSGGKRLKRFVENGVYQANWWNIKQDGTNQATTINSMLNAIPSNATVEMPVNASLTSTATIIIPKPVKILGKGATINYTGSVGATAVSIRSGSVTIDGLNITGSPGTFTGGAYLLQTYGTSNSNFYSNIDIRNCTINGSRNAGIYFEYIRNFKIKNNTVTNHSYGGILVYSGIDGVVEENTVSNIHMTGQINAYGIQVTRRVSGYTDSVPRNITIQKNTIDAIPWEGIDTHGGQDYFVYSNYVTNCATGIAIVSADSLAPENITVSTNHVKWLNTSAAPSGSAIRFDGFSATELATGIITANQCWGYAIKAEMTQGLTISSNKVERSMQAAGIIMNGNTYGSSIVDNKVIDVWHLSSNNISAIQYVSNNNTGYIGGNAILNNGFTPPGTQSAYKNRYFIRGAAGATGSEATLGTNDTKAAISFGKDFDMVKVSSSTAGTIKFVSNANYTVLPQETHVIYTATTAGNTLTLPDPSKYDSRILYVKNESTTNGLIVSPAIRKASGTTFTTIGATEGFTLISNATEWRTASGNTNGAGGSIDTVTSAGLVTKSQLKDTLATYVSTFDNNEFQQDISTGVISIKSIGVAKLKASNANPGLANWVYNSLGQWVEMTSGTGSTTTDASLLTSGTLNDARLSANVPLLNQANTWTGTQNFSGIVSPTIQTSSATTSSNFAVVAATSGGNTTTSQLLFGGASGLSARVIMRGSGNSTISANYNYSHFIIGDMAVSGASTGTHNWVNGLTIRNFNLIKNAGAITNQALLYIEDPNPVATNNYSLFALGKGYFSTLQIGNNAGGGEKLAAFDNGGNLIVSSVPADYFDDVKKGTVTTSTATTTNLLTVAIPDNTYGSITLDITAMDVNGNTASFRRMIRYKKIGTSLTLKTAQTIGADDKDSALAATSISFTAQVITGYLNINVTGISGLSISWKVNYGATSNPIAAAP